MDKFIRKRQKENDMKPFYFFFCNRDEIFVKSEPEPVLLPKVGKSEKCLISVIYN